MRIIQEGDREGGRWRQAGREGGGMNFRIIKKDEADFPKDDI